MSELNKRMLQHFLTYVAVVCVIIGVVYYLFFKDKVFYSFAGVAVPDESIDFIGTWSGKNMVLRVPKWGQVHFRHKQGNDETTLDLPLQTINLKLIELGLAYWKTDLAVQVPPHEESGKWHMTVENTDLTRQE
jgi:hypothetical protein